MEEVEGSVFGCGTVVVAGATVLVGAPTTEGTRALHVLTGSGPVVR